MKGLLSILAAIVSAHLNAAAAEPAVKSQATGREHWAFKSPLRPVLPDLKHNASRIANPIDAFIFSELEKHDLTPTPEAPKEILLRRVYLDLTGLPPTHDELHAFLGDRSPHAYETVVDHLLNSRQYGERWARHWMDIWRYADWYGRRHVPDVWNSAPQVWRWRDWIVRSLNADKGYDRMIAEMLAADEVAPEDSDARVATGYLVRNWYALNPNQWMRDIVEHTGKAFLGLTFNCAHCHDHKYDPITQPDYFQFRAFFEPVQVRQDWVNGEPDPGPFQKYEYSSTRKVVRDGMVSVFDEQLDAKTFIYLHGDERSFPEGKPAVEPLMPAFLQGDSVKPKRLNLPVAVQYPGLKSGFQRVEIEKRERSLNTAKDATAAAQAAHRDAQKRLAEAEMSGDLGQRAKAFGVVLTAELSLRKTSNQLLVAQADLESLHARIAADQAKYSNELHSLPERKRNNLKSPVEQKFSTAPPTDLAMVASRAERLLALRKAEFKLSEAEANMALLQAEQSLASARRSAEGVAEKKEEKAAADAALKKLEGQRANAQKFVQNSQAALETNSTAYTPLSPIYPSQSTGRRRALATWMTSRQNPLTARVAVNHIWTRHFHVPLVASVFDFGRNGARPTHPDLLDWLAVEFMDHDWSMKHLHRLIVTSSVYRQSSAAADLRKLSLTSPLQAPNSESEARLVKLAATNKERDPENRYLWRMNSGQMEAEVVRDSILFLADELDLATVGYPLANADAEKSKYRSLYFECFPEPNGQSAFGEMFDPPNPTDCYRRTQTIVPQQALALANSKLSNEQSRRLAQRLAQKFHFEEGADPSSFITAAYEQILARRPTNDELTACREFLNKQSRVTNPDAARATMIHALFNHNDFLTIR